MLQLVRYKRNKCMFNKRRKIAGEVIHEKQLKKNRRCGYNFKKLTEHNKVVTDLIEDVAEYAVDEE